MNANSLFKVLVLGGALLTAGPVVAEESATLSSEAAEQLGLAFCNAGDAKTCTVDANGKSVVREGLTCCWGTSCDDGN